MRSVGEVLAETLEAAETLPEAELPDTTGVRPKWVPIGGPEWIVGTVGLSPAEKGVLMDIIADIISTGECSEAGLLGRAGAHLAEIAVALQSLEAKGKIERRDCLIKHSWARERFLEAAGRMAQGRKAARARWGNHIPKRSRKNG